MNLKYSLFFLLLISTHDVAWASVGQAAADLVEIPDIHFRQWLQNQIPEAFPGQGRQNGYPFRSRDRQASDTCGRTRHTIAARARIFHEFKHIGLSL